VTHFPPRRERAHRPAPERTAVSAWLKVGDAVATCQRVALTAGAFHVEHFDIPVRVLAVAEGYAMVRRKGCSPFVMEAKRVHNTHPAPPDKERP
jgi:hypothetical protein